MFVICIIDNFDTVAAFPVENLDTLTVDMFKEIYEVNLLASFHVSKVRMVYTKKQFLFYSIHLISFSKKVRAKKHCFTVFQTHL